MEQILILDKACYPLFFDFPDLKPAPMFSRLKNISAMTRTKVHRHFFEASKFSRLCIFYFIPQSLLHALLFPVVGINIKAHCTSLSHETYNACHSLSELSEYIFN